MQITIINTPAGDITANSSHIFYPPGGTIGTSEDNHFVLPDPSGCISALQASVHISAQGACTITNIGTAFMMINNIPLARGETTSLQENSKLQIGDYYLTVDKTETTKYRSAEQEIPETDISAALWDEFNETLPPEKNPTEDEQLSLADFMLPKQGTEPVLFLDQLATRPTDPMQLFTAQRHSASSQTLFQQNTRLSVTPLQLWEEQVKQLDPLCMFKKEPTAATANDMTAPQTYPMSDRHEQAMKEALFYCLNSIMNRFDPSYDENSVPAAHFWHMNGTQHRKAKLWDNFTERYQQTTEDIRQQSSTLFNAFFLSVYQQKLNTIFDNNNGE
ncbi:type VI secretion system-associated FHA domain protein [Photorhabdus heterorhabditis]|uniref:type VI secretion system-associated FHA domain protein n=1 Tax=Photorhabdus heterorhabditis TaxID=880156 RepID=UPI001BD3C172|nr:type VI secretion system-associated FHA domain protein [Photorhabdus heterorhabditis]